MIINRRRFMQTTAAASIMLGTGWSATRAYGQPSAPKPEKLVIIIASGYADTLAAFGQEYTEKTGIVVEVVSQSYDTTYTKIVTSLAGGAPVDVVICDSIWMAAFVQAGFLKPMDDHIAPIADQLVPAALEQRRINGSIYAMPISNEGKFFYYNEELLAKAGISEVPQSWEQLKAMAEPLAAIGVKHPIIWGWQQAEGLVCDYTVMVKGFGGTLASPDGVWLADREPCVAALATMVDQLQSGIADPASTSLNDRQVVDSFGVGNNAFLVSWSFAFDVLDSAETSSIPGKVKLGLIPGSDSGDRSGTVLGGSAFGIAGNSPNEEWAWDFIQFITDQKHQIDIYDIRSNVPVWNDLYRSAEVEQRFPFISVMRDQFDHAAWRPNTVKYAEQSAALQKSLHRAILGEITPEAAVDEAASAIAAI